MQLLCNYMHCFTFYIRKHTPSHSHCIRRERRGSKEVCGKVAPLPLRARGCCCSAFSATPTSWGSSGDTAEFPQSSHPECQRNTITFLQQPKLHRAKLKIWSPYDFLSLEPQKVGILLTVPLQQRILGENEETLVPSQVSLCRCPQHPVVRLSQTRMNRTLLWVDNVTRHKWH